MDLGLEGKVAAVAASSRGLGLACAMALAREGAHVAICARDVTRLRRAAEAVRGAAREAGHDEVRVTRASVDLAAAGQPEAFLDHVRDRLGPVDILVANNGGPPPGLALEIDDPTWARGFEQTFLSSVRLARGVVPAMRERGWGRIIFVTSISVKQPVENLAISTALRCGVTGFAKTLADEVARAGVTVNCVAPGSTATDRWERLLADRARRLGTPVEEVRRQAVADIPAGRPGRPGELAAAVAFLASEAASFVTGIVLAVDGGQSRAMT